MPLSNHDNLVSERKRGVLNAEYKKKPDSNIEPGFGGG
jgi:hypothetical protein